MNKSWLPRGFEFLAGLPESKRRARIIVTLQAYLDESGVKGTHPVFVFAGFLGRAEHWAAFSQEWRDWLDLTPRVDYIKMNEAAKRDGEFRSWTIAERDAKLRGCVAILKKYPPQKIFHVSVDIAEWQKRIAHELPRSQRDPYFTAFWGILSGVCYEVIDTGVPDELEMFFDDHSIFRPRIERWYPWVRSIIGQAHDEALARILPPNPIFKSDKEFLPLQASDVAAWMFRGALSGDNRGGEFNWIAEELEPVIPMSTYSAVYDAARIEELRERATAMIAKLTPEMLRSFSEQVGLEMMEPKKTTAYKNFNRLMEQLVKVPHDELKTALDAEKRAKKKPPKKKASKRASARASGDKG